MGDTTPARLHPFASATGAVYDTARATPNPPHSAAAVAHSIQDAGLATSYSLQRCQADSVGSAPSDEADILAQLRMSTRNFFRELEDTYGVLPAELTKRYFESIAPLDWTDNLLDYFDQNDLREQCEIFSNKLQAFCASFVAQHGPEAFNNSIQTLTQSYLDGQFIETQNGQLWLVAKAPGDSVAQIPIPTRPVDADGHIQSVAHAPRPIRSKLVEQPMANATSKFGSRPETERQPDIGEVAKECTKDLLQWLLAESPAQIPMPATPADADPHGHIQAEAHAPKPIKSTLIEQPAANATGNIGPRPEAVRQQDLGEIAKEYTNDLLQLRAWYRELDNFEYEPLSSQQQVKFDRALEETKSAIEDRIVDASRIKPLTSIDIESILRSSLSALASAFWPRKIGNAQALSQSVRLPSLPSQATADLTKESEALADFWRYHLISSWRRAEIRLSPGQLDTALNRIRSEFGQFSVEHERLPSQEEVDDIIVTAVQFASGAINPDPIMQGQTNPDPIYPGPVAAHAAMPTVGDAAPAVGHVSTRKRKRTDGSV